MRCLTLVRMISIASGLALVGVLVGPGICADTGAFEVRKTPDKSVKGKSVKGRSAEGSEAWDRDVDQVALQAQDAAAHKLLKLIKKYANTRGESALLMRLSEVYDESSSIEFRIEYARSHRTKTPVALGKYHSILKSEVDTLSRLISVYPQFFSLDQSLFMRGKAYEELEDKVRAKADYLALVQGFPRSSRVTSAYMALAEMAITANQHQEAISYLKEVERSPEAHSILSPSISSPGLTTISRISPKPCAIWRGMSVTMMLWPQLKNRSRLLMSRFVKIVFWIQFSFMWMAMRKIPVISTSGCVGVL